MELIKDLGTRLLKCNWVRYGLFLCPYCFQEVIRIMRNGLRDKSCSCVRRKLTGDKNKGKKRTRKTRQKMSKARIGKKYWNYHTEEWKKEQSNRTLGENNPNYGVHRFGEEAPNWQNGKSFEPYAPEFNRQIKQFILERDNYTCQDPNCGGNHKKLHVHHIDYDKNNNSPENLITLCNSCHAKTTGKNKRQYFTEYYQNIMIGKVMGCFL